MRNPEGMVFEWIRTYRKIFKSALVYLENTNIFFIINILNNNDFAHNNENKNFITQI